MNLCGRISITLLLLAMAVAGSAASVRANTAANAQIVNTATLSYRDGTQTRTVPASVTVSVALLPSPPVIVSGGPQIGPYAGPTAALTNTFTITATSNGPDTYAISSAIAASSNTTGPTATLTTPSTITLGATLTIGGSSLTVLNVPSDGVTNPTPTVNGISAGSTVVVGTEMPRQVLSVVDNATGTSTITLASPLSAAPGAGVLVAEQKTVSVNVTAGTINAAGINITVAKSLTATSSTNSAATATSGTVIDTFTSGLANFKKYVRNASVAVVGAGEQTFLINGTSNKYYLSGVTAKPNEILEYVLVVNNIGSGPLSGSTLSDLLPTSYVSFINGAYGGTGKDLDYVPANGADVQLTSAAGDDAATLAGATLTVNVGTGAGIALSPNSGGTIANGTSVKVAYQVRVNP